MSRLEKLSAITVEAAEAWYHGQYYRDYTPPDKACKYSGLDDELDSDETNHCLKLMKICLSLFD